MSKIILAVNSDFMKQIVPYYTELIGDEIELLNSSDDKLDLIEHVDRHIDLIVISNNDYETLSHLLFFFREFNQLLEFIPILIKCDFELYKKLNSLPNIGIIGHIDANDTPDKIIYSIKHCFDIIKNTNDLREENYNYRTKLRDNFKQLELEKQRYEQLLMNILPEETSRELMIHGFARPQLYKKVTVLFTDFKGFTTICEKMTPEQIVHELDFFFTKFDEIIGRHFGEKIKTIGDAYMCAGGIPLRNNSNPVDMVLVGLEMQQFMNVHNQKLETEGKLPWNLRVGIHTGRLITGVIGKKKFAYDIWGDAVNTAARMESSGEAGKVNISGNTYRYIHRWFNCTYRGKIYAKNKGEIDMYFVEGLKAEYSVNNDCKTPNELFLSEITQI
ncbi:MAG: adenylate/guanylate cyclase domain-containing protein [Bacteroidales bacterium]